MLSIEIVSKAEVIDCVENWCLNRPSMALGMLFSGDRWSCIDQVAIAKMGSQIVGIATIAPRGEMMGGKPTIVAIYVTPEFRSRKIGTQLLEATVNHMIMEKLTPIKIEAFNSKVLRMVGCLPAETRGHIHLFDQSMNGLIDAMLDM